MADVISVLKKKPEEISATIRKMKETAEMFLVSL